MVRYGMVIDLKRCIGCYGCVIACKAENATPPGIFWAQCLKAEWGKYPNVRRLSLPTLCMHCRDPPCVRVCPTGASQKRSQDGICWVDKEKCIGCRYCMTACPYGARFFHDKERYYFPSGPTPYEEHGYKRHKVGTVLKCDFCLENGRLGRGLTPACAANCMAKARTFGDLDDTNSEVSRLIRDRGAFQLQPEFGTDPQVYYLPP